jgi:hypothetical protein
MLESTVITSKELLELRSSYYATRKSLNKKVNNKDVSKEQLKEIVMDLAWLGGKIECITNILMIKFKMGE